MPKRDEIKIRERTNLYDLLDDGIENGSDLETLVRLREEAASAPSVQRPPEALPRPQPATPVRAGRSWGGVLIGSLLLAAGGSLALYPQEMVVWHAAIRYVASSAEYVSPSMARVYGIVVASAGVLVLLVSLVRMRNHAART